MHAFRARAAAALLAVSPLATAQVATKADLAYPTRSITMIVSFPAGAGADLTARTVAQKLTESMGQPVVVDNRAGANGILGTSAVAKATPDGYTILLTDRGALGINPSTYRKLAYDPLKDFEYIGVAAVGPYVLAIKSDLPVKNYAEFLKLAKSKPGAINYASFGVGSMPQLNMEAFKARQGINLTHVPYKGGAQVATALLSGEVDVALLTAPSLIGPLKSGKVRALAVGASKRSALLPEVPTMIEVGGGDDAFVPTYFGFAAPAGTPRPIIERLNKELNAALASEEVQKRLESEGAEALSGSPEAYASDIDREEKKWGVLVRKLNLKLE